MDSFDGHVHSVMSDGTDTPAELVAMARAEGLSGIALVDHDTFDGWDEVAEAADREGVLVIRGAELSMSYRGSSAHLLAYLPDPTNAALTSTMARVRSAREERLQRMVEAISVDFPRATWQRLLERQKDVDIPWGRPHLADLLVTEGYVRDRDEAFASLLKPGGPYFAHQWAPHPAEMVEIVRQAGGVPVLAHPSSRRRQRPLPEAVIGEMTEAGLFGMERDHREHDSAARAEVDRLADQFGLAVTGGSDFHGEGKPNRLGENLTLGRVVEGIVEQGATAIVGGGGVL